MKGLLSKLRESLFDDEDEILSKSENDIYNITLQDPTSPFRNSFKISETSSVRYNNGIINIIGNVFHDDNKSINYFFPHAQKLNISGYLNIKQNPELNSTSIINKIECTSLNISSCKKFNQLHITINNKQNSKRGLFSMYPCVFYNFANQMLFNDTYLKFNNIDKKIHMFTPKIPIFNEFRSNVETLLIYDKNIFKNIKNTLNDIFIFPFKTIVKEYGKEIDYEIKNFRMLRSMISSYKFKYCGQPIYNIRDIKFIDILNISRCPYLHCVILTDGIDCLQFDREDKICNKHGNILNQTKDIYTKDGWRITLFKYKAL